MPLGPLRTISALLTLLLLGGCDSTPDSPDGGDRDAGSRDGGDPDVDAGDSLLPDAGQTDAARSDAGAPGLAYPEAVFRSTHNSYSGGARGSLIEQLDEGVRFLELDLHDNAIVIEGDYRIGHVSPGDEVMTGSGNPTTLRLGEWLRVIADWSTANPAAAPITIGLDLKDDLTDNQSFAAGNLARLNEAVTEAFGARLFTPEDLGGSWPSVDALRGRIIVVVSGHEASRVAYVRDLGARPAVAINASGQVVEVHDSGRGSLWYWTGTRRADDTILWRRHGRYDSGQDPAVALTDDGYVIEVHQSDSRAALFYRVGRLDADLEIEWGPSQMYDDGVAPSVRLESGTSRVLREIHLSDSTGLAWEWSGTLDPVARRVTFTNNQRTSDAPFDADSAGDLRVFTRAGGAAPAPTLRYDTSTVTDGRIRYAPVMFVEFQPSNDADLEREFSAARNGSTAFARQALLDGRAVRLWEFDEGAASGATIPTFPATDEPRASWYDAMCDRVGCVE